VKDFTDSVAWKLARELRKAVFEVTKRMPTEEKYVLVAQLRRAAMSVTANLAEGFGRFSYQENIQFCRQARGSAFEVRDHLTTALDAAHILGDDWKRLDELPRRVIQVINGHIHSTRSRQKSGAG
jgi:four helix bundle protein